MNSKLSNLMKRLRSNDAKALREPADAVDAVMAFELEQRVLYSATPIDFAEAGIEQVEIDATEFMDATASDESTGEFGGVGLFALEELAPGSFSNETPEADIDDLIVDDASNSTEVFTELLIIDESVDDHEALIDAVRNQNDSDRNFLVVMLDSDRDGISQISEALASIQNVDSIHLVSHGTAGGLQLGNSWLNQETLGSYQNQIEGWQSSLSEGADFLIYGCNLAASEAGQSLVTSIGAMCDCDVAASDDTTGHADLGADWDLEFETGDIETEIPFELEVLENWVHELDVTIDSVSTGQTPDQASVTISHTTSGGERLLLVGIGMEHIDEKVDSVTYDGQNLTLVGAEERTDKSRVEIWSLVAPDLGAHDVVVTMTDDTHKGVTVGVMSFNGVDQSTPLVNFASESDKSDTASVTSTSAPGDLVFSIVNVHNASGATPSGAQTEHWDLVSDHSNSSGTTQAGALSVTSTWAIDDEEWAAAAVSIQAAPEFNSLWLSTAGDVNSPSGVNGLDSWTSGDALSLGSSNLAIGSGTSNGTLSSLFNLDDVVDDGNGDLDAFHLVTTKVTVGSGANSFELLPGDILFSTAEDESFDGGLLTLERKDVGYFRPNVVGDFSLGVVGMLLDDLSPGGGVLTPDVQGITLIEQDTVFGDTILRAGDFLFTQLADFAANDVFLFETSSVGDGTTTGNRVKLLEGSDLGLSVFSSFIQGIDLVEKDISLGGTTLSSGTLLLTSYGNQTNVGDSNISTSQHDVMALDVSMTEIGSGSSAADISVVLDGSDIGLDSNEERLDSLALGITPVGTRPTDIAPDSFSIDEDIDTSGGRSLGTLTTVDPNVGDTFTYSILPGSDGSVFSIGGTDNDELIIDDGVLDFETKTSYTVSIQVTDSTGNTYDESLTVTVNPVNDNSPVADTESFTVDEGGTATEANLDAGTSLLDGDTDLDLPLDSLSINTTPVVDVLHGTLVLGNDGTFTYTHDGSENFTDRFTYEVIDAAGNRDTAVVTITINDTNDAPTVSLTNTITTVPEDTTARTKIADIVVTDDAIGTETLTLSGTDAAFFEIVGNELFLRANSGIDFEAQPTITATVSVDDTTIGSGAEDSDSHTVFVANVNKPPSLSLTNVASVPEDADTSSRIKVADIVINDDAPSGQLLFSTDVDVTVDSENYLDSEVVQFGDLGDTFSPEGATSGSLSKLANFDAPGNVRGLHYVETDLQLGTSPNHFDLQKGDLLIAFSNNNTTLNAGEANQFNAGRQDIVVFRPSDTSDYTEASGEWFMLVDSKIGNGSPQNIHALTLVEQDTVVGGTELTAGTLVVAHGSNISDIRTVELVGVGTGSASTVITSDLLLGADLGTNSQIQGLHLVQQDTRFGNTLVESGTFLVEVNFANTYAGVAHNTNDIIALQVTQTEQDATPGTAGTGKILFRGDDIGLSASIDGFTVASDYFSSVELSLTGSDASLFEIDNGEVFLRAGTSLDFETKPNLGLSISIDDPSIGSSSEGTTTQFVNVVDVNEAPSLVFQNIVSTIPENSTGQVKIADIVITDDALGSEILIRGGADASKFEIIGTELFLRADAVLDHETQSSLFVNVSVDDPTLGGSSVEDTDPLTITVSDVNEAPSISLTNLVSSLPENHDTSSPTRVADIVVTDDAIGSENLFLSGSESSLFEIVGSSVFLRAGSTLDFETNNHIDINVEVDDPTIGSGSEDVVVYNLNITDVNESPTVSLINTVDTLPELSDTSTRTKIADIVVTDDGSGTTNLSLSGSNAGDFEIDGNELYLRANTPLDHETLSSLEVVVSVDDPAIGSGVEDSQTHVVSIVDENEAPSVQLINTLTSIPEDTSTRTKVADIVIDDDALGSETLTLTGANASLFEIDGSELYLVANANLDHETVPNLDVTVEVNDPTVGTNPDDSASHTIAVADVNETPHVDNPVGSVNAVEDDPDFSIDLSGVFADVDGDSINLTVSSVSDTSILSATLVGSDLVIDFLENQFGTVTIDVTADDGLLSVTDTITVNVSPENDAPTLIGDALLNEIYRDSDPAGELTRDIVSGLYSDIDGDQIAGIAVVSNEGSGSDGSWQYFDSSGWQDIGSAIPSNAVVIDADSLLRFNPASGYHGSPTPIKFIAIDNSYSGSFSSSTIVHTDASTTGGTSPFSDEVAELGIVVRQFGIDVTPTSQMITSEAGQNATFEVVLAGEPTGEVIIPVISTRPGEGRPSVTELRFTPSNWSVPQAVTVFGINGFIDDGDANYEIEFGPVQSTDVQYDNLNISSLNYVNLDDDVASIVISETKIQTDENGLSDQFDVTLSSKPRDNVSIEFTVSDASEAVLSTTIVEFTPTNWRTPQTITVTGQNDNVPDGDAVFQIFATPRSVGDTTFNSLSTLSIDAENQAAIGPRDTPIEPPTTEPEPEPEEKENDQVEFIPRTVDSEEEDRGGVNSFANEPRTVIETERSNLPEYDIAKQFVATQYWRKIEINATATSLYTEATQLSEEAAVFARYDEIDELGQLWGDLDNLEERIEQQIDLPEVAVGTFAAVASTFSAGYLVWLIRGGQILVGVLTQMPAWSSLDMLAVLSRTEDEDEGESLESIVSDSDKSEQPVAAH